MRWLDFITPLILSLFIHGLVFFSVSPAGRVQADIRKEPSAVKLRLAPPAVQSAAEAAPVLKPKFRKVQPPARTEAVSRSLVPEKTAVEKVKPDTEIARVVDTGGRVDNSEAIQASWRKPGDLALAPSAASLPSGRAERKKLTSPLQVVGLEKPPYPAVSRSRGEEGTVVLSAEIDDRGRLTFIRLVESSGHPRLDQAAIATVKKAGFIPETIDKAPVASSKRFAFTFRLEDAD